jgi:CheY-like chemotaxis protein
LALAASDPPHGRILVVESQAIIALDLQRILREAGYRVVGPAASLEEVGPLLRRGRVDCAVADVDPVSGELPAIAELLDSAGVPLVVLGGGHGLAGRPTLDKPYTPPELLEAIETAIAGPAPEMPAPSSASAPRLPWPRVFPSL